MFAVIKTGGKQYRVAADDVITIERLEGEAGGTVTFEDVLLVGDGEATTVGTPVVAGARVTAEVVEQARGPKITILKKRRRKSSRKKQGHRQDLTVVRITGILTEGAERARQAVPEAEAARQVDATSGAEGAPQGGVATQAGSAEGAPAQI